MYDKARGKIKNEWRNTTNLLGLYFGYCQKILWGFLGIGQWFFRESYYCLKASNKLGNE
jgi:hypothetical protein